MDNLASSFLKYGDEVLLYSESMAGFLYSEGWFDEAAYLPVIEKDKIKYMLNFIFKVQPKLSYDAKTQLMKMENTLSKGENENDNEDQKNQDTQDFMKNKEIISKRCEQEEYYNMRTLNAKYGEFVFYGRSEIELVHKSSGKILTICRNQGEREGNCLQLREQGTPDRCDFKIIPRYKYRAEGEKIIYDDYFVLMNERTKMSVYISPQEVEKKNLVIDPPDYRPVTKIRRNPAHSMFSKHIMKVKPRKRHAEAESERFISGGDIVMIKHTEIGGHLWVDGSEEHQKTQTCFVRKYRGTNSIEESDSNCLFEIEMHSKDEKGRFVKWKDTEANKNTVSADLLGLSSGEIEQENNDVANSWFRLRHLNSGLHLIVKSIGKNKFNICLDSSQNEKEKSYQENTLFTLESQSVDPDERLKSSIVVKIRHVKTGTYISTSTSIDRRKSESSLKEENELRASKVQGPSPFKLNTRTLIGTDVAKHFLEANSISKDEDAFIIEQTTPSFIKDILSVHAAVPLLKEYVWEIRTEKVERLKNKERMKKIEKILTHMIFFVTDTEDSDPFTCEGIPFKENQKLMRELKVIEIL